MERIILLYKFCTLADPVAVRLWQEELCRRLHLRGRIIVATTGINATLGGHLKDLKAYKQAMNTVPAFRGINYKWSFGRAADFPKLSVKVRSELVTLDASLNFDPQLSSTALSPRQWHEYLRNNPQAIVLDARNRYESELGYFKADNLIRPDIGAFKEIKAVVAGLPKDQPIMTYCTGDVRCEYLSAYMLALGFGEVYHLNGGIMKYGQVFGDTGLWAGKCYVFDRRLNVAFSPAAVDLATCSACSGKTSEQVNCDDCNHQLTLCGRCQEGEWRHCENPTVSSRRR